MESVTTIPNGSSGQAAAKREGRFKICRRCLTGKPYTEDHWYFSSKRGKPSVCKECHRKVVWERAHDAPFSVYQGMLDDQNGRCAICEITLEEYRRKYTRFSEFHLDHNHTTGVKRGLLCHNCNRAIGMLQDKAENILRAYEYLKRQDIV